MQAGLNDFSEPKLVILNSSSSFFIYNDLLVASNRQEVSALVLLHLSEAFDTIDHQILLTGFSTFFGFSGTALSLLESDLSNLFLYVNIENHSSDPHLITTGSTRLCCRITSFLPLYISHQ